MKALYIYNKHSKAERDILDRVKEEIPNMIEVLEISNISDDLKMLISRTPALIVASTHLQGTNLLEADDTLVLAEYLKALQEEELAITNEEVPRLDKYIQGENIKAVDNYTLELIEGGIL